MPVRMRFRTDGWHYADLKALGWTRERFFAEYSQLPDYFNKFVETPPAQPGDVWRIHWYKEGGQGPLAGYAICCPKCGHVHNWTVAGNCSGKKHTIKYLGSDGSERFYDICEHNGVGSCWTWTGSAEDNTLTASPSLQVTSPECGFHGWLENGELRAC